MKKLLCVLIAINLLFAPIIAQTEAKENKSNGKGIQVSGKSNTISAGIHIPIAGFSSTHNIGFGVDYSWSNHRFGRINEIPVNPVGFTANIGINYYFGKKENIGQYDYTYSDYKYLYSYGGIIYNPGKKGNIILTVGPAIGIYSGHTQFNIGANLRGNYYVKKSIAIASVITIMKESKSDPLWAMAIQVGFSF